MTSYKSDADNDGSLLSEYLQVVIFSLTICRKYLISLWTGNDKVADGEEEVACPVYDSLEASQRHPSISLNLLLTTFALAVFLTVIRQLFLYGSSALPFAPTLPAQLNVSKWFSSAFTKLGISIKDGGRVRFGESLYGLLNYTFSFSITAAIVHSSPANGNLISNLDAFLDGGE